MSSVSLFLVRTVWKFSRLSHLHYIRFVQGHSIWTKRHSLAAHLSNRFTFGFAYTARNSSLLHVRLHRTLDGNIWPR